MLPGDQYVAAVQHPHVLRMRNWIVPNDFTLRIHDEHVVSLMAGAEKFVRPIVVFMPEIALQATEPFKTLRIVWIDVEIRPDQFAFLLSGRFIERSEPQRVAIQPQVDEMTFVRREFTDMGGVVQLRR